jgi:hypothetical protein
MRTETVTTHDIRVGDRIASQGMVLLVDREPHQTRHPVNEYSPTLATAAVIENWAELVAMATEGHSTAQFIVHMVSNDMSPHGHRARNDLPPYTEPRWTIQGNRLAHWARIIP